MDQGPHFTQTLLVTPPEIFAECSPLETWENSNEVSGNPALCPRRACNARSSSNREARRVQRHGVRFTSGLDQPGPHNHDQAEGCSSHKKAPFHSFVLVTGLLRPAESDAAGCSTGGVAIGTLAHQRRCHARTRFRRSYHFPARTLTNVEPKRHERHYDSGVALDLTFLRGLAATPVGTSNPPHNVRAA
jgi:hypothetical protein